MDQDSIDEKLKQLRDERKATLHTRVPRQNPIREIWNSFLGRTTKYKVTSKGRMTSKGYRLEETISIKK